MLNFVPKKLGSILDDDLFSWSTLLVSLWSTSPTMWWDEVDMSTQNASFMCAAHLQRHFNYTADNVFFKCHQLWLRVPWETTRNINFEGFMAVYFFPTWHGKWRKLIEWQESRFILVDGTWERCFTCWLARAHCMMQQMNTNPQRFNFWFLKLF